MSQLQTHTHVRPARNVSLAPINQGRIKCESGIARAAKRCDADLPEVLNGFKSSSVGLTGHMTKAFGTLINSLKMVNSYSKAGRASTARPFGFIALCLTMLTAPLLAQDPVSYWSFNEGAGSQVQDSFSSHHGTLEGATWTTGILGSGLDFNSQGARVSVPGPSLDGTNALTLALWFKADSFAISDARLLSRAQGTAANDHDWMLSTISTGGQIRLRARLRTNGSTETLIASSGALSTAAWYHAAFVYDGSQMRLYLDGQQVGSTARSGSLDERSGLGIALANQPQGAGAKSFDGALDEVRIFNRALNQSEIQALADPCDGQPVASFDVTGDGAVAPATLNFDASSSSDCDGTLTQYTWDFGDGGQGQGVNASHLYAAPGTYTVTLTVEDDSQNTATSEQTVTLSDGQPLAHWTLDDSSGTQALDSRGGFHGTLDGAVWVTGIQGGALEFDGTNDRVTASGPGISGDQLTISAWLKADDFDVSDARILSRSQGTSESDHDWMLSTVSSGGQIRLRARLRTNGSTTTLIASSGVVTPGDWIHAAVTYDGASLRLFQDGLEVGSAALTGAINERVGLGVALGNQPSGAGDRPFDGTLDDIRIYARALNNAELADLADPCNGQPIASFTWDRLAHDTLSFDAAESSDCDGTLTSYDWDFGDGQSGTGVQTQHTYAQGGIFAIQLTVTDNQGNTHSNSQSVQIYEPGQRIQEGLVAEYHLGEGSGALVQDVSGVAPALDLTVADPNQITWESCGGLTVDAETLISSSGPATKLNSAIPANDEITIEAWLDPASLNQTGPARIVTLSDGAYNRNFTLGQDGGEFVVRLRTTQTGLNGSNPVTITNQGAVRLAPTHVVYTRNADGQAAIYVDGVQRGSEQIGGDLSNWSSSYSLALANEINDSRSWLGTLYLVAVYDRALSLAEIAQNYQSSLPSTCNRAPVARASASTFAGEAPLQVSFSALGSYDLDGDIQQFNWDFGDGNTGSDSTVNHSFQSPGSYTVSLTVSDDAGATASRNLYVTVVSPGEPYRISQDLLTFYAFREGADTQVFDLAGGAAPLDLEIQDGDHVNWLACGGLRIIEDTIIGPVPVPDWNIVPSRGITLEAWVKPENTTQGPTSPSRVITYSDTPTTRNFTLGQKADEWDVRFRTTQTGTNGSNPSTSGGQATTDVTHVVYTWDGSGMGRLYVNGTLAASQSIGGDISNWDLGYAFALANEINPMERSFLGDYHLVALYDRALNASEVQQNHAAGLLGFSIIEPQVSASADPGQVLVGQIVAFDAQANTGCYAQIAGWLWEFGDGTTASAPQVNHAYAQPGSYTATVTVTDTAGATGQASVQVIVVIGNQPPTITSSPVISVQAAQPYSYDVEATDGDGDTLVFSLTQAPAGMTIDGATGLIAWTPSAADVGDHPVAILVDDQNGGTDSQSYTLTVSAAPNQVPEITSTPITTAIAVEPYSYDVEATDGDGDVLVYSLTQAPAGMTIDASSGLIEWTPDVAHQGDHPVSVLVDDQQGGTATQSFTLSVTLPTLAITISQPIAGALVTSPVTLSGVVSPAQAEVILDGQSLGSGSTNWNTILTLADGTHTLTAEAQLQTLQESTSVTFVVDNTAPSVQIDAPVDVMKGQNLDFTVTASDANAIVQLLVTLNGETLYDGPNASFNGSWPVPADYSGGPVLIQATATDEVGLQTLEQQSVDVLDLTLDLVITEPDDGSAHSQADVRFSGTVSPESASVTVQGQATQRTGQVWEATLTLADGQHLIPVEATAVGATPLTLNRTITVDTQGPVISYTAPAIFVRGFSYTVTVTAADDSAIQSLDVSLNATPYPAAPGSTRSFQVQVPSDEPLTQYSFTAHAVDALGHSADLPLDVPVRDLSELDRVQVVIQSPDHGATFLDPNQTIQGHLVPADAALFLYDQPVPVQPDGTFSHPASLSNGLNTFLFYGRKDGYLDGVGKVDLYLDNTAPEVRVVYPADGLRTNQQLIDIYGTVSDTYDRDPALTRDGNPVPVSSGRFREDQVTLQPGANTFTYIATDATGHSGQAQVTIHLDQSGPGLSLSHDPWVRPGASFNVNLSVTPAETVRRLQLFVDHQLVHDGTTGDAFQGQFQAGLFTTQIPIRAVCRDSYGNRVEENGSVQVTRAHYAFGRVLDDGTSHPVPGMQVTLTSPEGTSQATTDASGRYEAYVYGYPLTVAVNHAEYAAISRRSHEDRPIWRVPDLRLTARNQPIALSGNNLVDLDWMTVQLSGAWNGSARVTAVGPQAIAELLPLGFSPVAAFEVTDAAGSGTLNWNVPNLSRFPIGADLVFLSLQTDGWQVLATETVQAKQIATSFANQANGAFLAAIMDSWKSESVPAVGTFLRRSSDLMVPPNTLAESQTNPPSVSIVDEPQTVVSVSFQAHDLLRSGAQARILAAEQHDRIDGLLTVPDSILDVFCYAYEFGRHDQATAIGGRLNLRALETVSPDITRYARIDLDTYPGFLEQGAFLEQPQWDLGNLHLDFSGSVLAPVVVDVQTLLPLDLPQINGVEWLTAFQLTVGGTLPTGAQLSYDYGSANHLVLLRQLEARTWVYAGQLTQSGESWLSSALVEPLDRSGTYALMAVQFPLTEITGTVLNGATPVVDARISNNRLPWFGVSRAAGVYATVLPQADAQHQLLAYDPISRRSGTRSLSTTAGQTALSGIDIALADPDFRVVESVPVQGETHLALIPQLSLSFSMPVSLDLAHLVSHILLEPAGGGSSVPLQVVPNENRTSLSIVPVQVLAASQDYQLRALTGLENLYGDTLSQPFTLTFSTRALAQAAALDLAAFHMRWDGSNMHLEAPAEAVAPGTRLRVLNHSTFFTLELDLLAGAFSEIVDAQIGDSLELQAQLTTGETLVHHISLVNTPSGGYVLGNEPSRIPLPDGNELWVDRVDRNALTEVRIESVDETQALAKLTQVQAWDNLPPGGFHTGLKFVVDQPGTMPAFEGRLVLPYDETTMNNKDIHLLAVGDPQMLPPDPNDPAVLEPITLGRILSSERVTDNEQVSKRDLNKFAKTGLQEIAAGLSVNGAVMEQSTENTVVGWLIDTSYQDPETGTSAVAVNFNIDCLSEAFPGIERPSQYATWHDDYPEIINPSDVTWQPTRDAVIYRVIQFGDGSVAHVCMGIADITGRATPTWLGSAGQFLVALDPVTNEIARVESWLEHTQGSSITIRDRHGIELATYVRTRVVFDPESFTINQGGDVPPRVSLRWEVWDQEDGELVRNGEQTSQVKSLNLLDVSAQRTLKAFVNSSQEMPVPDLRVNGQSIDQVEMEDPFNAVFTLPLGLCAQPVTLRSNLEVQNGAGQTTTVNHNLLVVDRNQDCACPGGEADERCAGNPVVITTLPNPNQNGIPIDQRFYFRFNEPVLGLQNIRLQSGGDQHKLQFFDSFGVTVTNQPVCEVYATADRPLNFLTAYTLTVTGITDEAGNAISQPYTVDFTTVGLETQDPDHDLNGNLRQSRTALWAHRNLMLYLAGEKDGFQNFDLHLFDIRVPHEARQAIWSARLASPRGENSLFCLQVFLPHELGLDAESADYSEVVRQENSRIALGDIPHNSIIAVTYWNHYLGVGAHNYLDLYRYDGNLEPEDRIVHMPLGEIAAPTSSDKLGSHLVQTFYGWYGDPGPTVVYDIHAILHPETGFEALRQRHQSNQITVLEYENALARLGIVSHYPIPRDLTQATSFYRKQGALFEPVFALAGARKPAIYPLDPSSQPPIMGITSGGDPDQDDRMLYRTNYFNNPGHQYSSNVNAGVAQGVRFVAATGQLIERDVMVTCHRLHGTNESYLEAFVLDPQTGGALSAAKRIRFPAPGLRTIAVDRHKHMVAVQSRDFTFSVLDLRTWLESDATATGFAHPAFFVRGEQMNHNFNTLVMHQGTVIGITEGGVAGELGLKRILIAPTSYRQLGWEYIDLNAWMDGQTDPSVLNQVNFARDMVFYATDLSVDGAVAPKFMMELGSFAVEVERGTRVTVTIKDRLGNEIDVQERVPAVERGFQNFSTHALKVFFNQAGQRSLRERGYETFELDLLVEQQGAAPEFGTYPFMVAFLYPDTRYVDSYRNVGGLDALSGRPEIFEQDHDLSFQDPRLNLSPQRLYSAEFAFQPGGYGVGFANAQRLHMAYGTWWDVAQMGSGLPNTTHLHPRVFLEHPGKFHLRCAVRDNGSRADVQNDLVASFSNNGGWLLDHRKTMLYQFDTRSSLTDYATLFSNLNNRLTADPDAADKLRAPVLRFATSLGLTTRFYGEAKLRNQKAEPWNNTLKFLDQQNKPATLPSRHAEFVTDFGGMRSSQLDYHRTGSGDFIAEQRLPDDMVVTYEQDDRGYLTHVQFLGERDLFYEWESVADPLAHLERFQLKRLKAVRQGTLNEGGRYVEYVYPDANAIRPSGIKNGFTGSGATKSVIAAFDSEGRTASFTVSGASDEPNQGTFFTSELGTYLSAVYKIGSRSYQVDWTRKAFGDRYQILLETNQMFDQSFEYDNFGRVTGRSVGPYTESWIYTTGQAYNALSDMNYVYRKVDGREYQVVTTTDYSTITNSDGEVVTSFSSSGIPSRTQGLDGFQRGTLNSTFYVPTGNGYKATNGRQHRLPIEGTPFQANLFNYNQHGDLVFAADQLVESRFENHDALGRPRVLTYQEGQVAGFTYAYDQGRYVVTRLDEGFTQTDRFDERGRLRESTYVMHGDPPDTLDSVFEYDELDRLTKVTRNAVVIYEATAFFGDYDAPTQISTVDDQSTVSYQAGLTPRITGGTTQIDGSVVSDVIETDHYGRQIRGLEKGIGEVVYLYDQWDRLIEVRKDTESGTLIRHYQYEGAQITETDYSRMLTTVTNVADVSGFETTERRIYANEVVFDRTYTSSIVGGDKASGYQIAIDEIDSSLSFPNRKVFNAIGHMVATKYGYIDYQSVEANDRGIPIEFNGSFNYKDTWDDLDRLVKTEPVHENSVAVTAKYDALDRIVEYNDGFKTNRVTYHPQSYQSKDLIIADGMAQQQSVVQRSGRLGSSTIGAMGKTETHQVTSGSDSMEVANNTDGRSDQVTDVPTSTTKYDAKSGNLMQNVDYGGDVTEVHRNDLGHLVDRFTIKGLENEVTTIASLEEGIRIETRKLGKSGAPVVVLLDAYGGVKEMHHGENFTRINRDSEYRPTEVTSSDGVTYRLNYDQDRLVSITGGEQDITLADYTPQGKPQTVNVGALVTYRLEYTPDGHLKHRTIETPDAGDLVDEFDDQGRLLRIRHKDGTVTEFTRNVLGLQESLDGRLIFGEGVNLNDQEISEDTTQTLNENGKVIKVETAGLAPVETKVTTDERISQILLDETLKVQFTYDGLYLSSIEVGANLNQAKAAGNRELLEFSYDELNRIRTVNSDLRGELESYDYNDRDRVEAERNFTGLEAVYGYDGQSNLTRIDVNDGGPTFVMSYDEEGNLSSLEVDGLQASFEDYVAGRPSSMVWGDAGDPVETFTLTNTLEGYLDRVESDSGAFTLDLDWATLGDFDSIVQIVKDGPSYGETWSPIYSTDHGLESVQIANSAGRLIQETYNISDDRIPMELNRIVDGQVILDLQKNIDSAMRQRLGDATDSISNTNVTYSYASDHGGLSHIEDGSHSWQIGYDWLNKIQSIQIERPGLNYLSTYEYDVSGRQVTSSDAPGDARLVAFWHGNRVFALGLQTLQGIEWTHAFGYGPMGPVFVRDLKAGVNDAYIFTDHLGTPFAYKNAHTGEVTYTPFSPWGELMAVPAGSASPYTYGAVDVGVSTPPDTVYSMPPLGLSGHLYDEKTGLVQMVQRAYAPRLGTFVSPDLRAPSLYSPSSYDELYAFAHGNPIHYWDPDGRLSQQEITQALRELYAQEDPRVIRAYQMVLSQYRLVFHNQSSSQSALVDHEKRVISIPREFVKQVEYGQLRRQTTANVAAQYLYEVLADEFPDTGLPETWGHRVGRYGLGSALVVSGVFEIAGGFYASSTGVGFLVLGLGADTVYQGWTTLTNREGGKSALLAAVDFAQRSATGEELPAEWYKQASSYVTIGTVVFGLAQMRHVLKRTPNASRRVLNDLAEHPGLRILDEAPACFVAGTPIATPEGWVAIEEVGAGEVVWTYDVSRAQWQPGQVAKVFEHAYEGDMVRLQVANDRVVSTGNHPFWVVDGKSLSERGPPNDVPDDQRVFSEQGRWVEARDLQAGDLLRTRSGTAQIAKVETFTDTTRVYNLEVATHATYAVSPQSLLVHNKSMRNTSLVDDVALDGNRVAGFGEYEVGGYKALRDGRIDPDLRAHHVGQKRGMRDLVEFYDPDTAPSILVHKIGHNNVKPGLPIGRQVVSRKYKQFKNARDLVARDIRELRRVYPDIPNKKLLELIELNKRMYPEVRMKRR